MSLPNEEPTLSTEATSMAKQRAALLAEEDYTLGDLASFLKPSLPKNSFDDSSEEDFQPRTLKYRADKDKSKKDKIKYFGAPREMTKHEKRKYDDMAESIKKEKRTYSDSSRKIIDKHLDPSLTTRAPIVDDSQEDSDVSSSESDDRELFVWEKASKEEKKKAEKLKKKLAKKQVESSEDGFESGDEDVLDGDLSDMMDFDEEEEEEEESDDLIGDIAGLLNTGSKNKQESNGNSQILTEKEKKLAKKNQKLLKRTLNSAITAVKTDTDKMKKNQFTGDEESIVNRRRAAIFPTATSEIPESLVAGSLKANEQRKLKDIAYEGDTDSESEEVKIDNPKKNRAGRRKHLQEEYLQKIQAENAATGRRKLSRTILKNEGDKKYYKKDRRNPRVHQRNKYKKAMAKLHGSVPILKEKRHSYGGEESGINMRAVKSTKF
ncbi:putative Sas10 C-terminal domain containing protein [Blattamonas nauphoetae]|uniref:Sas10 C-terminal domain containing protein n=1 Tax=Blattamonas nauphoetae TaxID=2049346 RepID=A0ABQ9YA55_9EUKA|nr:putative Sas10 C-terminal domain containing protein [Blattamonas nauphoetae]